MIDILKSLVGLKLEDIVLAGYFDPDEPAEFAPMLSRVYLIIGERMLQLALDETTTIALLIRFVETIEVTIEMEEELTWCRSSMGDLLLKAPQAENVISKIIVYFDNEGDREKFRALEFVLSSGQLLFFDPLFIDGINFGGQEQKDDCLNHIENYTAKIIS